MPLVIVLAASAAVWAYDAARDRANRRPRGDPGAGATPG
jgi:hypothetical protein